MEHKGKTVRLEVYCDEKLPESLVNAIDRDIDITESLDGKPSEFHTRIIYTARHGFLIDIKECVSKKKAIGVLVSLSGLLVGLAELTYRYYPALKKIFFP